MKKRRVEVHLDIDLYNDLLAMSLEQGKSISDVVRDMAKRQIAAHQKKSKKFTEFRKLLLTTG